MKSDSSNNLAANFISNIVTLTAFHKASSQEPSTVAQDSERYTLLISYLSDIDTSLDVRTLMSKIDDTLYQLEEIREAGDLDQHIASTTTNAKQQYVQLALLSGNCDLFTKYGAQKVNQLVGSNVFELSKPQPSNGSNAIHFNGSTSRAAIAMTV